jgi:DNA-binding MarR family transcriptional regulator
MSSTTDRVDFGVLLNLAFGALKGRLHDQMREAGFDDLGPSFGYVFRLLDRDSPSLAELAAKLGMTPQGALKIVSDMTAKGYVDRADDASDARVRRLVLAPRGKRALAEARKFHAAFERELGRQLGERRVASARAVLEAMAAGAAEQAARPF